MEKRKPLQQMLLRKAVIHLQKLKLDPCLSPYTVSTQHGSRTLISHMKLWS
jgi:hypothetical protein